jgi:hypothetical protein
LLAELTGLILAQPANSVINKDAITKFLIMRLF